MLRQVPAVDVVGPGAAEGLVRRPAKSRNYPEFLHDFEEDPKAYAEARERMGVQIECLTRALRDRP